MDAVLSTKCSFCQTPTQNIAYCCEACEILDSKSLKPVADDNLSFSFLDQPNFKSAFKMTKEAYDYELYVEGLHCSSCIHLLEKIPDFDSNVINARVDYSRSLLQLTVEKNFSLAAVAKLLHSWGYTPHFLERKSNADDFIKKENRAHLKKLAIAGACAGNIMLFVIPVYSGLSGQWATVFNWMSFLLFLPVLFYSAIPFYQGAWTSLRYKTISVDLPITVALLGGFALSTVNLVRGNGAIYYDSTASFLFLIMCARYYIKRTQQKFLSGVSVQDFFGTDHYVRISNGQNLNVRLEEIQENDVVALTISQMVPVDGIILNHSALFDTAVLNGEPLPRLFEPGMKILAGSKLLSKGIEIKACTDYENSYLAGLLAELKNGNGKKSQFVSLTDKLAQKLILTVFFLAIVFFIAYFQINPQEAFNRSLALIVLACPCALAFGSPLAFGLAMKDALKKGILIKNSSSLEKLLKVENIFFDKTGTLTDIDLELNSTWPVFIDEKTRTIILSLEQESYHPIAFAIRKCWPQSKRIQVTDRKEQLGRGVSGTIENNFYELIQDTNAKSDTGLCVALLENGKSVCRLFLEAPLRQEAPGAILNLKNDNHSCYLLTGDISLAATSIGYTCHIPSHDIFSSLKPEDKQDIVRQYKNTCMIGDGTNDALALRAADVGIAVKGSTFINLQAADIYFTRAGLTPLVELFELSKKTKRVLISNLTFSLTYNLIGGILALTGFVSPLLAAILMPVSSFLIIASTLWGFR